MNPFDGYKITSPFGWRNNPISGKQEFHTGIDLVKAHQALILAFVAGEVIHAKMGVTGSGFGGFGIVVAVLDRSTGHLHCYAHLDSVTVKVGDKVAAGQVIGKQGSTGQSTGSHLHYEIRKTSSPSYGWIADRANNCFEPTQYLSNLLTKSYYDAASKTPIRGTVVHERVSFADGLKYIDLTKGKPYSAKGTDIRILKLDQSKDLLKFVHKKHGKVTDMVKEHKADFGFNFPYFYDGIPTGYVWADGAYVNGAWGDAVNDPDIAYKDNKLIIGKLSDAGRRETDWSVQGTQILVWEGKSVAKDDGQICQRTAVGYDKDGNILVLITDGRTGSDIGLTLKQAAAVLMDKGAVTAINGDGGGSTIIADKSGGLNQALNVGANERKVCAAVLVYLDKVEQPWQREMREAREWVIAQGISDGERPKDPVTREEVWTMLDRFDKNK